MVQKIVGWLDNQTILVHLGDQKKQALIKLNVVTGDQELIYETNQHMLTIQLNTSLEKIIVQEGAETAVDLVLLSSKGSELNRMPIDYAGYVNLDWNAVDESLVFISHYQFDQETEIESSKVMIWNLTDNSLIDFDLDAIKPSWYSSHLYLYINEFDGNLYVGDTRSEEGDQMISNETIDFYLHKDTFISLEESDINESQVHLMKDHPFLVHQGVLTIPKVIRGDFITKPFLSQSKRDGLVVGVIADESVDLNNELGQFSLCLLDFDYNKLEKYTQLPDNAPILLSPDEQYVLYGWQLEYIIDLDEPNELFPLISDPA
ncbi:hypothetical protein [Marinilactibacillus kalidii]|uniref:YqgU-like beta propeller domain-containing protein n=1 Tax=Marinilactibacillus kalidii TaxID=2820274 RepID=UPI001ABDCFEA|nr:hypothetical protein [Marinilactibacillus kalidii]